MLVATNVEKYALILAFMVSCPEKFHHVPNQHQYVERNYDQGCSFG
jgi:hypothetical protein